MSVSQEQIQKIAEKLSKIPGDNTKLTGDIKGILSYMDLLQELDTSGVVPTVSVVQKENVLRPDILKDKDPTPTEMLQCSKQKVIGNQIAITNIMK